MLNALNTSLDRILCHANFTSSSKVEIIGQGSDGIVFKKNETTVIKLFSKTVAKPFFEKPREWISEDQANREFKALQILTGHPNFVKLTGNDLEYYTNINISEDSARPARSGWGFDMEYLLGIKQISTVSPIWGKFVLDTKLGFSIKHRNCNVLDITCQLLSALSHLKTSKIQHRHLEESNIFLRLNDLNIFIMDFARAQIPIHSERKFELNIPDGNQAPKDIINKASFQECEGFDPSGILNGPHITRNKDRTDLTHFYFECYTCAGSLIPDDIDEMPEETSDYLAVRGVMRYVWRSHKSKDCKQFLEDETNIDYNDLMRKENRKMTTILFEKLLPQNEPESPNSDYTETIRKTKNQRLHVINNIISKSSITDACKIENYDFLSNDEIPDEAPTQPQQP